jgi:hypothetical protein
VKLHSPAALHLYDALCRDGNIIPLVMLLLECMKQAESTRWGSWLPINPKARAPLKSKPPVGKRPFASGLGFSFITKQDWDAAGEAFITASGDCYDGAGGALIVAGSRTYLLRWRRTVSGVVFCLNARPGLHLGREGDVLGRG